MPGFSKYTRVLLISVISNRMVLLFSGAHHPVGSCVMPELLTFCESVFIILTLINIIIDFDFFAGHLRYGVVYSAPGNQITINNKVDISDGNL